MGRAEVRVEWGERRRGGPSGIERASHNLRERAEADVVVLEGEAESIGGGAARFDHGGVVALTEEQDTRVVPEVHIPQLRVTVDAESADDKRVEMPSEEIGEIERAELTLLPFREHVSPGEELVAVCSGKPYGAGAFEGRVEEPSGAAVGVADENPVERGRSPVDHLAHGGRDELRSVVEGRRQELGLVLDVVGRKLVEDESDLAHQRSTGDDEDALGGHGSGEGW